MGLARFFIRGRPKGIEAHQVALVAVAFALDLDWDGDHPVLKSPREWPTFSDHLHGNNRTEANVAGLDAEQVYFQVFATEDALGGVRVQNLQLSRVILDAWDYYLRELPRKHGRTDFDYQTWLERRTSYREVWNRALERVEGDPGGVKSPFFWVTLHLCERVCGTGNPSIEPSLIYVSMMGRLISFTKANRRLIVDRE